MWRALIVAVVLAAPLHALAQSDTATSGAIYPEPPSEYRAAARAWLLNAADQIKQSNRQAWDRLDAIESQMRPWAEIDRTNIAHEILMRRQAIAVLDEHQAHLTAETARLIAELPDGQDRLNAMIANWFETHMALPHRTFALQREVMVVEEQMFTLLSENADQWTNENGHFVFTNSGVERQFQTLIAQRAATKDQALQAALAWADAERPATPTGSAQPPQQ